MVTFCQLLQMQAVYDLAYLATNVAGFIGPALVTESARNVLIHVMPFVLPLLHVFRTGESVANYAQKGRTTDILRRPTIGCVTPNSSSAHRYRGMFTQLSLHLC